MSRLIDADALKFRACTEYDCKDKPCEDCLDQWITKREIDNDPTVDTTCPNCDSGYAQGYSDGYLKCKEERPQGEWIPVSERLPDNETEVLFQYEYGQLMRVGYHIHDSTIYPFGYEDENETGWYDSEDNFICGSDEVIAWMPLPEPYKEAENV